MSAIAKDRASNGVVRTRGAAPTPTRSKLSIAIAAVLSGAAAMQLTSAIAAADSGTDLLGEIIVTARKRVENLQDVPQSIDVYTSKDLQNLAIAQFEDYATKTPSMSFISIGPGTQQFFMRGVSDGSNPNVTNTSSTGFFVDDLPMSYYGSIPDLHTYDIERIEVLNGPQGTLFGAGAMSGAIRIVTNKPDPNAFSAGFDVDAGRIESGANNTVYEGFVNFPIVEGSTALRLSGYSIYDGGFINNLLTTRTWVNGVTSTNAEWAGKNYNTQHVEGGRAAIKQVFSEGWQALLTYQYQGEHHKGAWDQDPSVYGDRNVSRFGPENGTNYVKTLDFHLDGDVGIADLVYASTYWSQPSRTTDEYSNYVQYSTVQPFTAANIQSFACQTGPTIQGGTDAFSGCNVPTMYNVYDTHSERWSNEVRLESKPGGRIQWLTGLYWEKTRQKYNYFYYMPGIQPAGEAYQSQITYYNNYYAPESASPLPEEWYSYKSRFDYLETTEFGDATFNITDQWALELGVQHFESGFSGSSLYAGYFWDPKQPSAYTGSSNKWNSKAGLNFKASKELLLYASFGQGFRDGGVNSGIGPSCISNGAPAEYKPDTLNNFEIGWKSTDFGGRMTWNGAIYYMPWKNYQTAVFDLAICPSTFNANLGNARIYGAESNIDFKATDNLSLQLSASYNDSHLITNTYDNPNFIVSPGERLPYVPYFNYSANIRYEKPLGAGFKGYAQYDIAHKGDMWSDLREVSANGFARSLQPAYEISNLRFGIEAPDEQWSAEAYIANLFDTNAVVFTNTGNYDHRETTNLPRVFGIRLSYRFGKKG
ncbi:MAG: TonB-dependent receptor [Steroidobacteraceae bacterium]|jgi:iron complex outermembrane recepter protein